MPTYKLTYYDARGRAEAARMTFAVAGQSFDDNRISFREWSSMKTSTPLGVIPILEVDGKLVISQSMAIVRYLARQFDLYGRDNLEMTMVDQIIDTCSDFLLPFLRAEFTKDETEKAKWFEQFKTEDTPRYLANLETLLKEMGRDGFAVGNRVTVADIVLYSTIENVNMEERLANYPSVQRNRNLVAEVPNIKSYLASRAKTIY